MRLLLTFIKQNYLIPIGYGLLLCLTCGIGDASAAGPDFYCDPVQGSIQNDGSQAHPWPAIEQVLKSKLVQFTDRNGKVTNPNAPVKPGSTIFLRSGYQGEIRIRSGFNDKFITIRAEEGHEPKVARIEIAEGSKWLIKGLAISPSFRTNDSSVRVDTMVKLGEGGGDANAELMIEDCFIYTVRDASKWTAQDWIHKAWSGIGLGRNGKGHVARNNYVMNTRFGINLCAVEALCEGNVVANFSADGMRVTKDGQTVRYNVIKNCYVSAKDGDDNHDDGIQAFLFNKGRGIVRNCTVVGNLIIDHEDLNQPFPNDMQGLGFFDGPLINFKVEHNVIQTDHYHGVSLYDAQQCLIIDNVCYYLTKTSKAKPWVMLGTKQHLAAGNTVVSNLAHSFNFKADSQVKAQENQPITEEVFLRRKAELLDEINQKFGKIHPVAKLPRL